MSWFAKTKGLEIVAMMLFLALSNQQPAGALEDPVYQLEQSSDLVGEQTVWIRKDAIKIRNTNKRVTILMQAPEWKVYVWSDKEKSIYSTPAAQWKGLHANSLVTRQFDDIVIDHEKVGMMNNLSTVKAYVHHSPSARPLTLEKNETLESWKLLGNYWTTGAFGLPPIACFAVQRYFGVPPEERYPLQFYSAHKYHLSKSLSTPSCSLSTSAKAAFAKPIGYKQAASEMAILYAKTETDLIKEFTK